MKYVKNMSHLIPLRGYILDNWRNLIFDTLLFLKFLKKIFDVI